MGSKAEYEARKAERQKRIQAREVLDEDAANERWEDIADRFVTAVERIADIVDRRFGSSASIGPRT